MVRGVGKVLQKQGSLILIFSLDKSPPTVTWKKRKFALHFRGPLFLYAEIH